MSDKSGTFQTVFERLKEILQPYTGQLLLRADAQGDYSLNTPYSEQYNRELFFGAVQIKKRYVSFYLMPVYMYPELLEGISPELRKRMQGKSCFNFARLDEERFQELQTLAERGYQRIKAEGLV